MAVLSKEPLCLQEPMSFADVACVFQQGGVGAAGPCTVSALPGCYAGDCVASLGEGFAAVPSYVGTCGCAE